jgi:hypothetical protein
MLSTMNPKPTDPDDVIEIAADVVLAAHADKELSDHAHDAMSRPSNSRTHMASDFSVGPSVLSADRTFLAGGVDPLQVVDNRPSIGARAVRACIGVLLAVCIGVASIVWQSYGDTAKQKIATWVPQGVLTSWLPAENPGPSGQPNPPAVQASAANAAAAQPVPPAQTAPEAAAPTTATFTPESAQLLQSMAGELARAEQEIEQLKASVAQLKASQQQMSRDTPRTSEARTSEARTSEARTSENRASQARAPEPNLRSRVSAALRRSATAPARGPMPPSPPPQTAAAPPLPQAAAPSVLRQPEPQPQTTAQPQAEELVLRPPMPVR